MVELLDLDSFLKVAGYSLTGMLALAYPLMKLVRVWSKDRADNSKDTAEAVLYSHLSGQVKNLSDNLDKAREDNNKLLTEVGSLRIRVMHLESVEAINAKFKAKLDQKDLEITALNTKLSDKDLEISELGVKLVAQKSALLKMTTENEKLKSFETTQKLPHGVSSHK